MTTHRELLVLPTVTVERHGMFVLGVIAEQGQVRKTVVGVSSKRTEERAHKIAGGMSHWQLETTE